MIGSACCTINSNYARCFNAELIMFLATPVKHGISYRNFGDVAGKVVNASVTEETCPAKFVGAATINYC